MFSHRDTNGTVSWEWTRRLSVIYSFWYDLFIPAEISSLAKSKHVILANASVEVLWASYTKFFEWTRFISGHHGLMVQTSTQDIMDWFWISEAPAHRSARTLSLSRIYTRIYGHTLAVCHAECENSRNPCMFVLKLPMTAWTVQCSQSWFQPLVEKCSQERTFSACFGLFA